MKAKKPAAKKLPRKKPVVRVTRFHQIIGSRIVRMGTITLAATALLTTLYAVSDYTEVRPIIKKEFIQVGGEIADKLEAIQQQIDNSVNGQFTLQFQVLSTKKKFGGGLDFEEQQKLCQAIIALDYKGYPECR